MKKIEKNSKKVLLVEDDVDILEILVEKFELLGFQVVSADNGVRGIEIFSKDQSIKLECTDSCRFRCRVGVRYY